MFRPRKRRLYTPITPPSDEENVEQQDKVQDQPEETVLKQNIENQLELPEKM